MSIDGRASSTPDSAAAHGAPVLRFGVQFLQLAEPSRQRIDDFVVGAAAA